MREKTTHGSPPMIHVVGTEGLIAQVNEHWLKKMEYEEGEVIGKSPLDFLPEGYRESQEGQDLPALFKDAIARDLQIGFRKKNGETVALTYNNFPQFDHDKNFLCSFATLSDNPDAGIMAYDMVLGKGVWSPKACSLLGITKEMEEVYFAHHCSRLHKEDLSAFENIFMMPLHSGKTLEQNYRIRGESGDYISVFWWAQNMIYRKIVEVKKEEAKEEEQEGKEANEAVNKEGEGREAYELGSEDSQEEFREEKVIRVLLSSIVRAFPA